MDFRKEAATKEVIRQWVSDNTETFIDDYRATFATDGTAILNIYNILYLKDLWRVPFRKLQDQTFRSPSGDVTAPFVGRVVQGAPYNDHEKAQAVAFSGETDLCIWFLLPKDGVAPVDLVSDLPSILNDNETGFINFKAPALDIDGENLSLKDLLQNKGCTRLFSDADLDGMLTGVSATVSEIKQKTKLQMDEKGFKAAAVTEIGIAGSAAPGNEPVEFFVDRPYLMVIEYQGLPLFISQISDPTEH